MLKVWCTLRGEMIPYTDLKTDHLCNIVEMLKRNAAPHVGKETWRIYPHYTELKAELEKRLAIDVESEETSDAAKRFRLLELD